MSKAYTPKISIKEWAESDRPREKLLERGRRALTDAELLAILIGSGSTEESAVELCRRILHHVDHDLNKLSKCTVTDLCQFKGIGEAKAISVVAAMELGRRRKEQEPDNPTLLNSSKRVYDTFKHVYQDLGHEEFWVLYLNAGCKLISKHLIGRGGNDFTPVDVKMIVKLALDTQATSIILTHNHPSSTRVASHADRRLTSKLVSAAKLFDLTINDHVIFTDAGYFSFRDEGLLDE